MTNFKPKFIRKLKKGLSNPKKAFNLLWRRLFPFGIKPKDPEAYRIGSWSYGDLPRVLLTQIFPGIEKVDTHIYKTYQRDIGTSVDPQEILALASIARFIQAKRILEIGTFNGNTTLNLAANSPDDTLITTIDLPADWEGKLAIEIPNIYVNTTDLQKTGYQYKQTSLASKVQQVFGDSAAINWSELNPPFDLIFIDGCHHYNYIKSDTQNALDHLSTNGVIIWHDYGMIEDVSRVVDELADKLKINIIRGTRLAVGHKN